MIDIVQYLAIGLFVHIVILVIIYSKKFLRWPDGILVAAIISFIIYCSGLIFWLILFLFFIPSSLLTKSNVKRKKNDIIAEKSSQRDGYQVLSNSFGLLFFALLQLIFVGINTNPQIDFLVAGTVFIASASSDTWSTEIGTLNKKDPRFILNLRKQVPKGTSGGISIIGTLGGFLGSLVISFCLFILLFLSKQISNILFLLDILLFSTLMGFLGQIIDSFLGATLQKKYYCPVCELIVEEPKHQSCNTENLQKMKNFTFLNNNTVNISANTIVMILAYVLIIITHFKPI